MPPCVRRRPSGPGCRPRARCPRAGRPGASTAPGRTGRSRPWLRRSRTGTRRSSPRPPAPGRRGRPEASAEWCRRRRRAPAEGRPPTAPGASVRTVPPCATRSATSAVHDGARAAARDRPTSARVRETREQQGGARTGEGRQRRDRVRGDPVSSAGASSPRKRTSQARVPCSRTPSPAQRAPRRRGAHAERQRAPVTEGDRHDVLRVVDEPSQQRAPRGTVGPERLMVRSRSWKATPARPPSSGCAYDASGTSSSIRRSGRTPRRKGTPPWGGPPSRGRGPPRQPGPGPGCAPSAVRRLRLQDQHAETGARQGDRRSETVRPGPHHDDVGVTAARPAAARGRAQTIVEGGIGSPGQSGRTSSACGPFWP